MKVNLNAVANVPNSQVACPKTGNPAQGFVITVSWDTKANSDNVDTTKRYVFTEEMLDLLKEKGFIRKEIVEEASNLIGWDPVHPDDMSEIEKENYADEYLEKRKKIAEGTYPN